MQKQKRIEKQKEFTENRLILFAGKEMGPIRASVAEPGERMEQVYANNTSSGEFNNERVRLGHLQDVNIKEETTEIKNAALEVINSPIAAVKGFTKGMVRLALGAPTWCYNKVKGVVWDTPILLGGTLAVAASRYATEIAGAPSMLLNKAKTKAINVVDSIPEIGPRSATT